MVLHIAPSYSFSVASGATAYPVKETTAGTATAGSSSFLAERRFSLLKIIVEDPGTADGTLTIAQHDGSGTTLTFLIVATAAGKTGSQGWDFGEYGIELPYAWTGIRAALTGTACRVRIVFRQV